MNVITWGIVLAWMGLIFFLSHQPGKESAKLSTGVTNIFVKTVKKVKPKRKLERQRMQHIVRKSAHFFIYLILGILVINALRVSGWVGWFAVGIAWLICVAYAASDEFHQRFVPGRGPLVSDVIIDSLGAAVGIGLYIGVVSFFF
ncbi:VanZ family protein [Bacillaceae bacterium W0354]